MYENEYSESEDENELSPTNTAKEIGHPSLLDISDADLNSPEPPSASANHDISAPFSGGETADVGMIESEGISEADVDLNMPSGSFDNVIHSEEPDYSAGVDAAGAGGGGGGKKEGAKPMGRRNTRTSAGDKMDDERFQQIKRDVHRKQVMSIRTRKPGKAQKNEVTNIFAVSTITQHLHNTRTSRRV